MSQQQKLFVGMGGWDLHPFNGVFYPTTVKKGFRKLEYYSRFFDLVELNATFYTTAFNTSQVHRWIFDVSENKNFIFTVKLFKGFTHAYDATERDLVDMKNILDVLATHKLLGGIVMQFPQSFKNTPDRLHHIIVLCKEFASYRPFVELRDASWNDTHTIETLQENGGHLMNVDLPPLPGHMPLTSVAWGDAEYVRLMGRNAREWNSRRKFGQNMGPSTSGRYDYFYTQQELEEIGNLIPSLQQHSPKTFVVFHNDPNANSLVNGFQLRRLLRTDAQLIAPKHFLKRFPVLESIGVIPATEDIPFELT